jgi:uncharacterized protein (UPF0332 family)
MLSPEAEQKVQQHLKLARGFLATAVVGQESSEFEERNALSRAYYAMFHACCAWLVLPRKDREGIIRRLKHSELLDEMHRRRGKEFGDFLRDMRGMRRAADYREEWKPQRLVTEDRLVKARQEILKLVEEAEVGITRELRG